MKKIRTSLIMMLAIFVALTSSVSAKVSNIDAISTGTEFKVASYNIAAKGSSTAAIADYVKTQNIDFVGFQEVDKNTSRNPKDMLLEISEKANYSQYFKKSIDYGGGEYGIGLISKYPLVDQVGGEFITDNYEGRGWQRIEVNVDGKEIAIYNVHLTWESLELRTRQLRELNQIVEDDKTEYKIITGDFNTQESLDEFDGFLKNYNIANGFDGKWLDTYIPEDSSMNTYAIDNIITSRNIKIKKVEANEVKAIGSDHKVLIGTYELLDSEEISLQLYSKTIAKAKELLTQTTRYTAESLEVLANTIKDAEGDTKVLQEEINVLVDKVQAAIIGLERIPQDGSSPVAHWTFDGDDPLVDVTGRGNDAVAIGTLTYVDGLSNLGKSLSTKDGYASVAKATDDLKLGTDNYSVSFWYKATNPGAWAAVLGDKDWGSGANPGIAVVQGQGQFYTTFAANGHSQQENIVGGTAGKVYNGKWHHIVAVVDRAENSTLYVDGEVIASTKISSTVGKDATVTTPFNIGADGKGNYRIDSLIDDVKVYRSVLSEEEIELEYETNRDTTVDVTEELVLKTEKYLKDLIVDPTVTTELETFTSEDGKLISKIFSSENDITVNDEGKIMRQPLVDKEVQVSYIVQSTEEGTAYDDGTFVQNQWIKILGENEKGTNKKPRVVPSMQEWQGANGGTFKLTKESRIIVAQDEMSVLGKAAEITKQDIMELFHLDLDIESAAPRKGDVVLTFKNGDIRLEEQGYALEIDEFVTIRGTEYRGVFFGTRSLLQGMLTSGDDTIAKGTAVDYPNYPIRKFMLDIGRKYFPMWYLEDMVKYGAWLKLTDFQSHLSEDTFNDYAAFRLESDIPNLTNDDGYYTKDEYREFQKHAGDYGVRVITEIDGPAHAKRFIDLGKVAGAPEKYKDLGMDNTHFDLSDKNGARQRVLNLMDEVLEEYLGGDDPVITTDAFNIGMDEYFGNQDDLREYALHMYDRVVNKYGKTAFAWDSNASLANEKYPKELYPMDDIVIDYWKWEEVSGGMKKLMDQGYKVVNGDHRWYIVPGAQIGFYDYANGRKMYDQLSPGSMVGWYGGGTVFPEGHPSIVGGTMLLWNDRGMFAGYTVNDIFARQQSQYPILAQSYWYGREDETYDEFMDKVDTVDVGPGLSNLNKKIETDTDNVYNFNMEEIKNGFINDNSGNGYDAKITNGTLTDGHDGKQITLDGDGYLEMQHKALKWPYTAVFDLTINEKQDGDILLFEEIMPEQKSVIKDGILTGHESRNILLKKQGDGTYRLTYSREDFTFEHDYTFEKGKPYRIAFSSDESKPTSSNEYSKWNQPNTLHVNGKLVSTLQGPKRPEGFTGLWWVDTPSMNMPLEKVGQNLYGSIDNFLLFDRLLTNDEIADLGGISETLPEGDNLALNKPVVVSSHKNDSLVGKNLNDGRMDTRWGSNYNSNTNDLFDKQETVTIDLENIYNLGEMKLEWQDAYAQNYTIQVSDDGDVFSDVVSIEGATNTEGNGDGKLDTLDLGGVSGRYLRIKMTKAVPSKDSWAWNYGYSLFEVEVYKGEPQIEGADKSELQALVELLQGTDKNLYISTSWQAFEDALEAAQQVLSTIDVTQEKVDAAVRDLLATRELLVLKASYTLDLEIAVEEASKVTEEEIERLVPVVAKEFIAALKEARTILDENDSTQEVVDASFERLANVMQYLSFEKGDKTYLEKLVKTILALDGDKYIPETWNALQEPLNQARLIIADENAMSDEVNEGYEVLLRAFLNLRLLPNKDALNDLTKMAEALDKEQYTEETWAIFEETLHLALATRDDISVSQEQIDDVVNSLNEAISNLVRVTDAPGDNVDKDKDEDQDKDKDKNDKTDGLPKTGVQSTSIISAAILIIVLGCVVIYSKKKLEEE